LLRQATRERKRRTKQKANGTQEKLILNRNREVEKQKKVLDDVTVALLFAEAGVTGAQAQSKKKGELIRRKHDKK